MTRQHGIRGLPRAVGSAERCELHDSGNFGQCTLANSIRATHTPKLRHAYRSWMTVSTPVLRSKSTADGDHQDTASQRDSDRPDPDSKLGIRPLSALALPRQYHDPGHARTVPRTDALALASSMRASPRANPLPPPAHAPAYGLSSSGACFLALCCFSMWRGRYGSTLCVTSSYNSVPL